jgi:acyl-CoA thioester hydrolase
MRQLNIGPIIFREECIFKKEIRFGDEITINMVLTKARKDFSRLSVQHHIMKNTEILCAILTLDIAWLDITERKLTLPPNEIGAVINSMPRDVNFQWLDK